MSIVEGLIESLKAPIEPFYIDFGLGEDKRLQYRVPTTFAEWREFNRQRDDFAAHYSRNALAADASWKDFSRDMETLKAVFTINYLSVEPRVSLAEAFTIAATAPVLAQTILSKIDLNRAVALQQFAETVEDSKNASTGTPLNVADSVFAGEPSGGTPTP